MFGALYGFPQKPLKGRPIKERSLILKEEEEEEKKGKSWMPIWGEGTGKRRKSARKSQVAPFIIRQRRTKNDKDLFLHLQVFPPLFPHTDTMTILSQWVALFQSVLYINWRNDQKRKREREANKIDRNAPSQHSQTSHSPHILTQGRNPAIPPSQRFLHDSAN